MSWRVLVRPEADRDLALARDWYEQQRKGLGLEFLDEISAAMRVLEHTPRYFDSTFGNSGVCNSVVFPTSYSIK